MTLHRCAGWVPRDAAAASAQVVMVLKKEVMKTQSKELEKGAEYRQMLVQVRWLPQHAGPYPEVLCGALGVCACSAPTPLALHTAAGRGLVGGAPQPSLLQVAWAIQHNMSTLMRSISVATLAQHTHLQGHLLVRGALPRTPRPAWCPRFCATRDTWGLRR